MSTSQQEDGKSFKITQLVLHTIQKKRQNYVDVMGDEKE